MEIMFSLPFSYVLLLISLCMLVVTTVYSCILMYHWQAYGKDKTMTTRTIILYFIGVVCLFIGMAIAMVEVF